jgi:hypothetical protein
MLRTPAADPASRAAQVWKPAAVVLIALVVLAACQSLADVTPGAGRRATIEGHTYDQVWSAAMKAASEHFRVVEQVKQDGIIRAEQSGIGGGWIGIYLTGTAASGFTVEVVKKVRFVGSWQDWEQRVLREIQDTLAKQPTS